MLWPFASAHAQKKLPDCQAGDSANWHNCHGVSTYENGEKYVGEFRNGRRDGQGNYLYPSGLWYSGNFSNDEWKGHGKLTLPSGETFIGNFTNHQINGQGIFTSPDGLFYTGSFYKGQRNGQGTLKWSNGQRYVGEFKDNKRHGNGTFISSDGQKYIGEYKDDKRHGKGTFFSPNGEVLQAGVWVDDEFQNSSDGHTRAGSQNQKYSEAQTRLPECPSGTTTRRHNCFGTQILANGFKYVGDWKNGKKHGRGNLTLPNGSLYTGEFKDDKIEGQGTFTSSDGRKYVGEWKDSKKNGKGTYTWPNGQEYVGEFKDDKRHGDGTNKFLHGGKYVGQFKDDKENGQGTLYSSTGTVLITGRWANGEFTGEGKISPSEPNTTTPTPSVASVGPSPALPKNSSGSAFRIAEGMFITNQHVIDACKTIKIGGTSGGKLVASDQARDLALVSIANDNGDIASVRTTRIQLNESITVAGFPLEGSFSGIAITNGTISRLTGLNGDINRLQISAPVQPGNSGGPLLDTAGNVIGVVSSKLNALKVAGTSGDIPQNVNFAITGNALRSFLDSKSFNYKEIGNERELTGVQIASRASGFTVLIECQR